MNGWGGDDDLRVKDSLFEDLRARTLVKAPLLLQNNGKSFRKKLSKLSQRQKNGWKTRCAAAAAVAAAGSTGKGRGSRQKAKAK